ncbi:MAG: hypothetical protein NC911_11100 [Candidatus Omnitrophica bacterium]|nr:hypothetical protein [Candidatus Omnitrophota bacterium]
MREAIKKWSLIGLISSLLCLSSYAEKLTLTFSQAKLGFVLEMLSRRTGMKLVTSTELADKLISAYLDGVEAEEAIDAILYANGLMRQKMPDSDVYLVRLTTPKPEEQPIYQTECLSLRYARARDVYETLKALGYEKNVAVDSRLNALLIRDIPERISELKYFVSRLDQDVTASVRVQVFSLRHIDVLDLWVVLPTLLGKTSGEGKGTTVKSTIEVTGAPVGEGQVGITGGVSTGGTSATRSTATSSSTSAGGTTGSAADITTSLLGGKLVSLGTGKITEKTTLTSELADSFSIIPDKRNNAVVVSGTEGFLKEVGDIIALLDKPVPQVSIEAVLVELTNEGLRDIGVKWGDGTGSLGKVSADYFYGIPVAPGKDVKSTAEMSFQTLTAELRFLESKGEANILANPRVTTLNNSPATIRIVSTIPVAPRVTETTEGGTRTTEYEFRDIGITLVVVPHITSEGSVLLEVEPKVVTAKQNTVFKDAVDTHERSTLTKVTVKDGQTLILGGLLSTEASRDKSGVPILGRIFPGLFSNRRILNKKTDLVMFLTPRILKAEDLAAMEKEVREINPEGRKK